ncbi:tRNA lysidine(34) synthetase TilS [Pseudogemmobacter sonorensis]|uniref:tRNA lysidine(34) synthetase TilS n=1 Tax=Pseudogemmobacter sonorensis TaxID=2989681 RepID=UPI0036B892C0
MPLSGPEDGSQHGSQPTGGGAGPTAGEDDRRIEAHLLAAMRGFFSGGRPGDGAGIRLGLAVSGGGDSMAMLHLMAGLAGAAGWRLSVASVDHRLRPESAEEAAFVARICARLGLGHDLLVWRDRPATGNLMQEASRARHRLLSDWARGRDLAAVCLGHTATDQAETFLMGLSRRSGLEGLAGMAPSRMECGMRFIRPLLGVERAALRDYLLRRGLGWRDDPSNENPRYLRARARKALATLAPLGITVAQLNGTIGNLADVRSMARAATAEALARVAREEAGGLWLDPTGLAGLFPEIRRRLLVGALQWFSGARHPPRAEALARLELALLEGRAATLSGVRFAIRDGRILALREPRAQQGAVAPDALWDHRWRLESADADADAAADSRGAEIRALGAGGLACLPDWRETGLPRGLLEVSPALWRGDALLAAPLALPENARKDAPWRARIVPDLASFIISH